MSHFKKFRQRLHGLKISNCILFVALFAMVGFLTYLFYFFPQDHHAATVASIDNHTETQSTVEGEFAIEGESAAEEQNQSGNQAKNDSSQGIGGGSIIGNPVAGKKTLPIYCVDKKNTDGTKYASLSFDAAWGDDDTIQILDILDKYNVKVTFFMTGGWVSAYPDMVKEIYSRGHDLGNHSENHKQMSKLDVAGQKEELLSVGSKVKELTGYDMFLFRPPYGDYNSTLITTAYSINYYPIQWSVDSFVI